MVDLLFERQSPELITIDLRSFLIVENRYQFLGASNLYSHRTTYANSLTLLPMSKNRLNAIYDTNLYEDFEYLYISSLLLNPTANFNNIKTLFMKNFHIDPLSYMGAEVIQFRVDDLSDDYVDFSDYAFTEGYQISDETKALLDDLFNTISKYDTQVLFTFTPYINSRSPYDPEIRIALGEYVTSHGYDFLDCRELFDEIGLDTTQDFYDVSHVNVLGAEKYTNFAMEYITNNFEFSKNYSEETVALWDETLVSWNEYKDEQLLILFDSTDNLDMEDLDDDDS